MVERSAAAEIAVWGRFVKLSHSVFALPFALSMLVVIWREQPVSAEQIGAIVLAIVAARTAAMTFNRIVDARIDALNPRTANRELPRGIVSRASAFVLLFVSSGIFIGASALLGMHCLILAPFVLALLFFYSLTKRFTRWSHVALGVALACAPGGVWYALRGTVEVLPLLLMAGVALWVAGFDILYSCQDLEFDRANGLRSVPAALGIAGALRVALLLHAAVVIFFALFGLKAHLGTVYYLGLALFAAVLLSQHRIVKPNDLSRIDAAFFTRNGVASLLFFAAVVLDSALRF